MRVFTALALLIMFSGCGLLRKTTPEERAAWRKKQEEQRIKRWRSKQDPRFLEIYDAQKAEYDRLKNNSVIEDFNKNYKDIVFHLCPKEMGKLFDEVSIKCHKRLWENFGRRLMVFYNHAKVKETEAIVEAYPEKYTSLEKLEGLFRQIHTRNFDRYMDLKFEKYRKEKTAENIQYDKNNAIRNIGSKNCSTYYLNGIKYENCY